jgi:hypothetical protein
MKKTRKKVNRSTRQVLLRLQPEVADELRERARDSQMTLGEFVALLLDRTPTLG